MRDTPLTVVVITRDRWPDLQRSLRHHEHPVVVVDNGSRDGTPELVRAHYPQVEVVELGVNHGAVARNVGVARARTRYVAFADDDSWWDSGALARAAAVLDGSSRTAVLAGRTVVGPDREPDPVSEAMASALLGTAPDLPGPSVLGFLACSAVVRRSAFLEAGGFDDLIFFAGEEELLALDLSALGWGLAYVSDVVAVHHPSAVRDHRGRDARVARNQVLTAVLRRPWPIVLRTAASAARSGPAGRSGLLAASRALPRALARRRRLPPSVERARRALDGSGSSSSSAAGRTLPVRAQP